MLASMRTTASSFFMKLLMGLLVISFAVWGVGDIVRSGNNGHLVSVGDATVSYPEFARAVNTTERMMQALGYSMPRRAVENQVLQRLVEEKILQQRLRDSGLEVDQKLLAQRTAQIPSFHDIQGKFEAARFEAMLQQRQISEPIFLSELASDIRAEIFTGSLGLSEIAPPAAFTTLYTAAQSERRDAVLLTIPASSVNVEAPDEAALQAYYDANKELLYIQPERRTIEYVTFSAKDLAALAEKQVTEEDVADRVASDPEHYKDAKLARTELVAEASEKAVDSITIAIEDALAAGDTMGAAVAKAGLNAESHMLRDITAADHAESKDALLRAVSTKGFSMLEGETSSIETTEDGQYFLVGAQSITAAEPKPFDMVKDDVKKRTAQRAHNKALRARAEEVAAALKDKSDWQAVAKEFGATGTTVSNIARGEKGPLDPALTEAVFERNVGEVAGPLLHNDVAQLALITESRFLDTPVKPEPKALEALNTELRQEAIGGYYGTLTQEYPVRVNTAMLQQIQAQEGGE